VVDFGRGADVSAVLLRGLLMSFGRLVLFCCGVDVVQKLGASLLLRFRISMNAFGCDGI
jgi:hypothetical protein